ncbi:ubiquinone biosynthesis O-methyltransferase [Streptomyces bingchenggensis BCW-1]|uniref:Ubiquinone biosynthesis O-methyltransferase n=1 Tax=Streptomyces bingchenggensis (strain BCW-1) TaxID=749414 RepID=D7C211_STRBB|nr:MULTISPECIES: methyltransferase domain-containing protein [Streptomyces]ADI12212.1 ubiquinone biosynthesis O-methyltransferase [Streptomyces bingchenggensis BCW-1]
MARAPRVELDSPLPETVDGRQIRAVAFQASRLEYVDRTLRSVGLTAAGSRALVVGSGRGLLARGLAGLGFDVVAIDPSASATAIAREADEREADGPERVAIRYETAPPEELGVADAAFDLVYYADTFEVTPALDPVLAEGARALAPDGVLVYDTVNRTLVSRLIYLIAFQRLPMTRIMPPGRYAAERLRTPAEMTEALRRHGLRNEDICDFKPRDPRSLVKATMDRRRGRITDEEIPPIVDFVLAPDTRPQVTYLGYARKA